MTATAPAGAAWTRRATAFVTILVAGIAAIASYRHGLEVVHAAGETGWVSYLMPGSADGVIIAASLVILNAAMTRTPVPRLAKLSLGFGVSATLAMNVAAGVHHGVSGALVSALPAVALVLAYELLMILIREGRRATDDMPPDDHPQADASHCPHGVADTVEKAVKLAYAHGVECLGEAPSQRQLASRFGLSRGKVAGLVAEAEVVAEAELATSEEGAR